MFILQLEAKGVFIASKHLLSHCNSNIKKLFYLLHYTTQCNAKLIHQIYKNSTIYVNI
jgi:hypothetical protein